MINEIFLQILTFFSNNLGGSVALGIIAVTISIRSILLPIILPAAKSQRKMMDLKSEVDALKKKYGDDKKKFQEKQLELYQKHNINPLAGCLPQLVQAALFIAFYHFLINNLKAHDTSIGVLEFLWVSVDQRDTTYILPVLASVSQLLLAMMLKPATSTTAEKKLASKTKTKKDDNEAQDMADMAQSLQGQMLFIMPIMIGFFAAQLPAGMSIYWITSSLFSVGQQFFVSGPGGLAPYLEKIGITFNK